LPGASPFSEEQEEERRRQQQQDRLLRISSASARRSVVATSAAAEVGADDPAAVSKQHHSHFSTTATQLIEYEPSFAERMLPCIFQERNEQKRRIAYFSILMGILAPVSASCYLLFPSTACLLSFARR
jgi:hypothetical protein